MDESERLTKAIELNATTDARVTTAAGSQESQSLPDQITADRYLASKRAAQRGLSGLRVMRREGNASG